MGQRSRLYKAKRLLTISIIANLLFFIIGIVVSFITNSTALLADAIDSLFNMLISLIVLVGILLSARFVMETRNLSYFKIEILSAFTVAILALAFAGFLIYNSINKLYTGYILKEVELGLVFSLVFGIASSIITYQKYKLSKRYGLLSLRADSLNSIKDTLSSFIAFIGILLSTYSSVVFDVIAAIIIALILASAFLPVIRESSMILVDAFNDPNLRYKIEELAKGLPYINRVLAVNFRRLGYRLAIEIELEVDGDVSVEDFHEIMKKYEERIKNKFTNVAKVLIIVKQVTQ